MEVACTVDRVRQCVLRMRTLFQFVVARPLDGNLVAIERPWLQHDDFPSMTLNTLYNYS